MSTIDNAIYIDLELLQWLTFGFVIVMNTYYGLYRRDTMRYDCYCYSQTCCLHLQGRFSFKHEDS